MVKIITYTVKLKAVHLQYFFHIIMVFTHICILDLNVFCFETIWNVISVFLMAGKATAIVLNLWIFAQIFFFFHSLSIITVLLSTQNLPHDLGLRPCLDWEMEDNLTKDVKTTRRSPDYQ